MDVTMNSTDEDLSHWIHELNTHNSTISVLSTASSSTSLSLQTSLSSSSSSSLQNLPSSLTSSQAANLNPRQCSVVGASVELILHLCDELHFDTIVAFSCIDTLDRYYERRYAMAQQADNNDDIVTTLLAELQRDALLTLLVTMKLCCKFISSNRRQHLKVNKILDFLQTIGGKQKNLTGKDINKYELKVFKVLQSTVGESQLFHAVDMVVHVAYSGYAGFVDADDMHTLCLKILRVFYAQRNRLWSKCPWTCVSAVATAILYAATMLLDLPDDAKSAVWRRIKVVDRALVKSEAFRLGAEIFKEIE